jgi:hypothetical protein
MRNYSILHFDVQFSLLAPNQNAEHAFPALYNGNHAGQLCVMGIVLDSFV